MTDIRYPGVLAAVRKGEKALWEIGDALIEAAGQPPQHAKKDKSRLKLQTIATELAVNGYDYSVSRLRRLRLIAHKFPEGYRQPSVAFELHLEAGSPEMLSLIMNSAPKDQPITKRYIVKVRKGLLVEQRRAEKQAYAVAKQEQANAEADRKLARALKNAASNKAERDLAERRERSATDRIKAARQKTDDAKPSPTKKLATEIKAEDVPIALVKGQFDVGIQEAKSLARKMRRDIEPYIDHLSKAFVEGSVEELLQVAEAFRKLAELVRKNQPSERGHLHAVA